MGSSSIFVLLKMFFFFFCLLFFSVARSHFLLQGQLSISPTFYEQLLRKFTFAKKIQTLDISIKKLLVRLSFEKTARKMLVKLPPAALWCQRHSPQLLSFSSCSAQLWSVFVANPTSLTFVVVVVVSNLF